ncbi:hypothetical protein [Desulfobacula sp.]
MADHTDWYDDFLSDKKADEKIVELKDIVEVPDDPSIQEDVIELTDIVEKRSAAPDIDYVGKDNFMAEENLEMEGDTGIELETDDPREKIFPEPEVATDPASSSSLDKEQLEAALERVIEKKFADKIDVILFEAMEKVIKKEILKIKKRLQKGLDQIGTI